MITFEVTAFLRKLVKSPSILLGIFLFLVFGYCGSVDAMDQYIIKLATLAPEGSPWMDAFHELNDEIKRKTDGQVKLKAYPGGVLGEDRDMLRKIRIGQIHAGGFTGMGLGSINGDIFVMEIPFLFQNYGEVDYVLARMDEHFRRGFEEKGYVLLGWSEIGFGYLLSNVPIISVKDIKGTKVWLWEGDPIASPVLRKAGITPIPLGIPDVLMALQTNLVEVVYAPPLAAIALQWFTKVKYMTDVPLAYSLGGILVDKGIFAKMPLNLQGIVKELFQYHSSLLNVRTRKDNEEAIRVMAKQGIKIVTPTAEETEQFKQISLEAIDELGSTVFSMDVLAEVRSHINQYRKAQKEK
ncbi:MAG: TRAP transporter substrate-binding protein DctP [Syntrophobacterales bacterium]|nr:MAG: TRAP transporter substrate-binding protein DctP [Syntrophobacterales bacterium]